MQRAFKGITSILAITMAALNGCNILNPQPNPPPAPVSTSYEYVVAGGITGSTARTVVDSTGFVHYTFKQGGDSQVTAYIYRMGSDEFDTLKTAYAEADFPSLESSYQASPRIMDGFNMRVTLNAGGISKTVFVETNASIPERLANLLRVLYRLSLTAQSSGQNL